MDVQKPTCRSVSCRVNAYHAIGKQNRPTFHCPAEKKCLGESTGLVAGVCQIIPSLSTTRMSVEISPSAQLGFPRPLTQVVKRSLYVTNSNSQPVAFKVKTTAPKQYCVRPNSGRMEPGERVEVQVLLQPLKEEPPIQTKCRDKFLIQSAVITADKETLPIHEFWALQEREKEGISEHKIRCMYLPPNSEPLPEENEDISSPSAAVSHTPYDTSIGAGAGGPGYVAEAGAGAGAVGAGVGAGYLAGQPRTSSAHPGAEPPISFAQLNRSEATPMSSQPFATRNGVTNMAPASAAMGATTSTTTAVPVAATPRSPQELESEVLRLRAQLASNEKTTTSFNGGRTATAKATSSGVPVHIVAAIAVGVFAITYLFF